MTQNKNWQGEIAKWEKAKILVIGDLILDMYIEGKVNRISPEAPVPVLLEKSQRTVLGGAGNVGANIASLRGHITLCGRIGNDSDGKKIEEHCREWKMAPALISSANVPTIRKTRVLAGYQQLLRIDHEVPTALHASEEESVKKELEKFIAGSADCAVVLSDYGKGCLTPKFMQTIISMCKNKKVPVLVDPKSADLSCYSGCTVIKPNLSEGRNVLRYMNPNFTAMDFATEVKAICECVAENAKAEHVILSLSERGVAVYETHSQKLSFLAAHALQVADVSGAGDTMMATLALGLACKTDILTTASIANVASGVVCRKLGTATLNTEELLAEIDANKGTPTFSAQESKVLTRNQLAETATRLKHAGKKVVFTNGCFDILHAGHVQYLRAAKEQGDILVVGLNADESVQRLKGKTRPIQKQDDRAQILAALSVIDYVCLFNEDTPLNLILAVKPDILVKGADWKEEDIVGGKEVKSWGGKVTTISFLEGRSTTNIVHKMQS